MTNKKTVQQKYPDASMTRIRGLKLFIVEARNPNNGYVIGLGYGETQTAAWNNAAYRLLNKLKPNTKLN